MESKVRLVRCPKCENLLPELSEYSVYKCGGCGALLRAKARNLQAETPSRVSEEASGPSIHVGVSEKSNESSFRSDGNADEELEGVAGPLEKPEEDASVPEKKMDEEDDPETETETEKGSLQEIETSDFGEEDGPTQTAERGAPVFSEKPEDPKSSKSNGADENPKTNDELLKKLEDLNEQLKKLSADHLLQPNKVSSQCGHGECTACLHIHGSHPPPSMANGGLCYCHQHHPHFSNPCIEMSSNYPPCSFCHPDHWYNPRKAIHRTTHQRSRWHYGIGCEENAGTSLRTCRPVAGAAPFITCFRCLELLRLPSENLNCEGKANAVVCGACAAPIFFTIAEGRRVVFSEERGGAKRVDRCVSSVCEHFGSGDSELRGTAAVSPPLPGSPLQEHFDYSSSDHRSVVGHLVTGSQSGRKNGTSRQESVKDASVETEGAGEVSSSDSSSREAGNDSGSDSFFFGIKKSLRDLSRLNQSSGKIKLNVSVNGIPVTNKKLKKAEKTAGTIYPGQYWYDYRAGFWGVMGGPCLGIVPPYMEELNFPLPKDCSGGTTLVFVNGRELHRNDLELLANRGLPTQPNRSYIIDISGKVLDHHTGDELDSLGKLAPTVEKMKRGFGMKPPRAAPASS